MSVPFTPGRTDGFRNYDGEAHPQSSEELLVDRAQLLTLTAPEMTVLVGGLRVLGANHGDAAHGVFTDRPGVLTNDFFVNLLKSSTTLTWSAGEDGTFVGRDRATRAETYTATRADLIFASNSQLRALSEAYATDDAQGAFVAAFMKAWTKVMNLDRSI